MRRILAYGMGLTLIALATPARAIPPSSPDPWPQRLINLDTTTLARPGSFSLGAGVRVFGPSENGTYGSLELGYSLARQWELLARGTFAPRLHTTRGLLTVTHGGNEGELLAKFGSSPHQRWAVAGGLTFPDTPASKNPQLVLEGIYRQPLSPWADAYFVPKAVFPNRSSQVALGGGVDVRPMRRLHVLGDVSGLIVGRNTINLNTGLRDRDLVWGLGLRYDPTPNWAVDLGWTNGTGPSTGASLTPGLGGATALYAGVTFRH